MKYCGHCGAQLQDEDKFCMNCGTAAAMNGEASRSPAGVEHSRLSTTSGAKSKQIIGIGLAVILVVVVAIGGWQAYSKANRSINNGGSIVQQGDWIYFANNNDESKLYKMKSDGSGITKLSDDRYVSHINVVGGWVYYTNGGDGIMIYKIRTDGSERLQLNDVFSYDVQVVDDWIYYIRCDAKGEEILNFPTGKICRMRTDGSAITQLNDEEVFTIKVADGWIYFINYKPSDNNYSDIYKMRPDGTDRTMLSADDTWDFEIAGDWVYYTNVSHKVSNDGRGYIDYNHIYKMRTDGTGCSKLNSDNSETICVADDYIYYVKCEDNFYSTHANLGGGNIYVMRTDGTERKKLNDDTSYAIQVVGDWIYYYNGDDDKRYKIRTDGSDRQLVDWGLKIGFMRENAVLQGRGTSQTKAFLPSVVRRKDAFSVLAASGGTKESSGTQNLHHTGQNTTHRGGKEDRLKQP